MKFSKLKKIPNKVSTLCLGTHNFFKDKLNNRRVIEKFLNTATDSNINFFDTADSYANGNAEKILGQYIKKNNLKKITIATKIGPLINFNPNLLQKSIDESLKRLNTECIDICYFHSGENKNFFNDDYWNIMNKNLNNKIKVLGLSLKSSLLHKSDTSQIESCKKYNISLVNLLFNPLFSQTQNKFFKMIKKNNLDLITRVPFAKGALFLNENAQSKDFTSKDLKKAFSLISKIKRKSVNLKILEWVKKNSNCKSIVLGCSSNSQIIENTKFTK